MRHRSGPLTRFLRAASVSLTLGLLVGCGTPSNGEAPTDPDAALRDTLGISLQVNLHRIALGGERDRERIFPDTVRAREGDVLAFETVDGRIHELAFEPDSLSPEVAEFLRRTRQLESPPLIDRGTRFLVDLTDAPDGRYVFSARTFGEPVYGVVTVGPPPEG